MTAEKEHLDMEIERQKGSVISDYDTLDYMISVTIPNDMRYDLIYK